MNIAYIVGTYPQPSETFIAREMDGLRARKHHLEIFSLFVPEDGPQLGITYGWLSIAARALRKLDEITADRVLARRWHEEFHKRRCDVILAHFGSRPTTVALDAAGTLPLIISLHARDLYVESERMEEKLSRAKVVLTCTRANLTYLHERYPAYADRVHLLYHGLPATWCTPTPARHRAAGEPLRLLAVGRLVEKKGFHILLPMLMQLQDLGVSAVLRIIGDGPFRPGLEMQIRELAPEHATLEPWAPPAQVRDAYAWADVFCGPSILAADGDRDGIPNVLLEAQATGLPAVGSRLSGIPEVIEDGVTGLLIPPGDEAAFAAAIAQLQTPERRLAMGDAAQRRIQKHFTAEQWMAVLEGILHDCLNLDSKD